MTSRLWLNALIRACKCEIPDVFRHVDTFHVQRVRYGGQDVHPHR